MRVSSAEWFKAGVALQRAGPTSLGIAPRACTILNKLLLLLLLLDDDHHHDSTGIKPPIKSTPYPSTRAAFSASTASL